MREMARKRSILLSLRHMAQVRVAKITVSGVRYQAISQRGDLAYEKVKYENLRGETGLTGCRNNGSELQKSQGLPECDRDLHNDSSKPFNYDYEGAKVKTRY